MAIKKYQSKGRTCLISSELKNILLKAKVKGYPNMIEYSKQIAGLLEGLV